MTASWTPADVSCFFTYRALRQSAVRRADRVHCWRQSVDDRPKCPGPELGKLQNKKKRSMFDVDYYGINRDRSTSDQFFPPQVNGYAHERQPPGNAIDQESPVREVDHQEPGRPHLHRRHKKPR